LRTFKKRADVPPFVFTTVFRDKDLQAKAKSFGALAVLDKPLDINDLREFVNRSLHLLTEEETSLSHRPQATLTAAATGF
jgi:FixJ family two-component response regulator